MTVQDADRIAARLAGLLAAGAQPAQVAAVIVALAEGVEHRLSPVLGPRGVTALFRRASTSRHGPTRG